MRRPTPGGRRWRRWGWLAPVVACLPVHLAAVGWGLPSPHGLSAGALAPLDSLDAWRRWPGALGRPHVAGHHLLAGAAEQFAAELALDDDARREVDVLASRLRRRAQRDPAQTLPRAALAEGAAAAGALSRLVVAGRLVDLALAAALVGAVAALATRLVSARVGPLVGLLVGLQPALVHHAATLDIDGPAAAWMGLSLAGAAAAALRRRSAGTTLVAAAAGVAAGLAAATRPAMGAAWPGLIAVLVLLPGRDGRRRGGGTRRLAVFVMGLAATFAVMSGWLDGSPWPAHAATLLGFEVDASGPTRALGTASAALSFHAVRLTWNAVGGPVLVLGLAGWLLTSGRGALRTALVVAPGAFVVAWTAIVAGGVTPSAPLPLGVVLALPAGDLLHRALAIARRSAPGGADAVMRAGAAARARAALGHGVLVTAAAALVALPPALDLVADKRHDTRPQVMAALDAGRAPGERVLLALEPFAAAPFPHPAPPVEAVPLSDLDEALAAPGRRPTWVVIATWPGGRRDLWMQAARDRGYTPVLVVSPVFLSAFGASVPLQFLVALWRDTAAP